MGFTKLREIRVILSSLVLLQASGPVALASCSSTTRLVQDPVVYPSAIIRRDSNDSQTRAFLSHQAWEGLLSGENGNGLPETLPSIDALTSIKPMTPQFDIRNLMFSTSNNTAEYQDGDLLVWEPDFGLKASYTENEIATLLGMKSGAIDIDAICHLGQDRFWVSLRDNGISTIYSEVHDGDVFMIDFQLCLSERVYTESQLQIMVNHARGSATPIGDVISLTKTLAGELLFSVQSPSTDDCTVYGSSNGGRELNGWLESDWGFQDKAEIDALCFFFNSIQQPPVLATDINWVSGGSRIRFKVRFANPGKRVIGFRALSRAFHPVHFGGLGFLALNPRDQLLTSQFQSGNGYPVVADSSGSAILDWHAPLVPPENSGIVMYFQVLSIGKGLSAPIGLRVL